MGRDASARRRHPWIFSGAVSEESGDAPVARVVSHEGVTLGHGVYSPRSQIRVRVWTWGEDEPDWPALIRERMSAAKKSRRALLTETDAVRYINSEGDFLSGIFLDKYGDTLVLQLLTEGTDRMRDIIIDALRATFDEPNAFEKSAGRTEEGLPDRAESIYGAAPDGPTDIHCGESRFFVDIQKGHKSGFYLDQRANRRFLRAFYSARGVNRRALDCFCHSGAFGVTLRDFFPSVDFLDSSESAMNICQKNWERQAPAGSAAKFIREDAFQFLREIPERDYDLVILDPPSFAKRSREVDRACRGYKDIQRLAFRAIAPGGNLAAFSCSHHIDRDLFQKVVFSAALDAGRDVQIVARFGHDSDHPVSLYHPEGEYLHGLFLRVAD